MTIDFKSREEFKKELDLKTTEEKHKMLSDLTRRSRELTSSLLNYETEQDLNLVQELVEVEYYRTAIIDKIIGGSI